MKSFNLLLKTKNKESLKKFLNFFNENINKNFTLVKKNLIKKKKKLVITILKSPHVNKSAQEQFEINFLFRQLSISTTQMFKFLIFLKKIKNFLFADIHFKIKFVTNNKLSKLMRKRIFNFDNFNNNFFLEKQNIVKNKKLTINKKKELSKPTLNSLIFIKLIDTYGILFK